MLRAGWKPNCEMNVEEYKDVTLGKWTAGADTIVVDEREVSL